jgi:uncharacterized membrane protein YbhN (UPF0104 family)
MNTDPPSAAETSLMPDHLFRSILLFVCLSGGAYLLVAVWAGWNDVWRALMDLGVAAVAVGLAATLANYLVRFSRWALILRAMRQLLPWRPNLMIYLGGLALTATPGKVGETIRSALLVRFRVPVSASLAAFFVDRLSDLAGVLLLASVTAGSGIAWGYATAALPALLAGFALPSLGTHVFEPLARHFSRFNRLERTARWVATISHDVGRAWQPRLLFVMLAVAMIAYGMQAAVFAMYVSTLWPVMDAQLALHYFLASTLIGAASMLPGGIGAMEASLIALLTHDGMPLASAVAATFSIRAVTLWFGILLGLGSIAWGYNRVTAALENNNTA